MRVQGPNASTATASTSKTRRAASGGGFSVATEDEATETAAKSVATLRTIGGIDALIALQSEDDATGRRRRAVARGRTALDALDELKHRVLAGSIEPGTLSRLKAVASELKGVTGEPGLDAVMAEIDLRVEVEIAKLSKK